MVLPVFFVPVITRFPVGLLMYWMTTNLWTVGQGIVTRRMVPKPAAAAEATARARRRRTVAAATPAAARKWTAPSQPRAAPALRLAAPRQAEEEARAADDRGHGVDFRSRRPGRRSARRSGTRCASSSSSRRGSTSRPCASRCSRRASAGCSAWATPPRGSSPPPSRRVGAARGARAGRQRSLGASLRELLERVTAGCRRPRARRRHRGRRGGDRASLTGDDLGLLIGRHGQTIDAIQYLANVIAWRELRRRPQGGRRRRGRLPGAATRDARGAGRCGAPSGRSRPASRSSWSR